jgi:NAD+--dinitrogen-reductase ADP-D-ribosyltransferase
VAQDLEGEHDQRWYGTNLVGVPARVLASTAFNSQPTPLAISGTWAAHRTLFDLLDASADLNEAHDMFSHYLHVAFGLRKPEPHELAALPVHDQRRWRSSWRKLLQGWGMDSNGPAGAVLKGWVESRFGLAPAFHKAPLAHFPSSAWLNYFQEKVASRYHNNNIYLQLDLVYAFCQWALRRMRDSSGQPLVHLQLWRGSNQFEEQLLRGTLQARHCTVRLNNVASFSLSEEDASCFGDWVMEVRVPVCKVLVFPDLLPGHVLQGEQEVLALGGDYEVTARYA